MTFGKTPIAWLQLKYQKAQTIAALVGIAFITILLFMQIGFRAGFLGTLVDVPNLLRGDLVMLDSSAVSVLRPPAFSQHRLYQALAYDEVDNISPVYNASVAMRDNQGKPRLMRKIQVFGFPLAHPPFEIGAVDTQLEKLKRTKVFLLDEKSRPEFRSLIDQVATEGKRQIEIRAAGNQTRISLEGIFPLGANTSANSHMMTSDTTFFQVFGRDRGQINIGLIYLKPDTDVGAFVEKIRNDLPDDVMVLDKRELISDEEYFYEFKTPIGAIFRFGLGAAIVVGIVILYQILFQLITKYLRDYATLKAIGFSHQMLRSIVLREALILAVMGFLPGFAISLYMYDLLTQVTSLRFTMTSEVAVSVLVAICMICLISAMLAIRKLREADPADLFG